MRPPRGCEQSVPLETDVCSCWSLLAAVCSHGCSINSICQVVEADKNTNDCRELAPKPVCWSSL